MINNFEFIIWNFWNFDSRNASTKFCLFKNSILEILSVKLLRILIADFDCWNWMENWNANFWKLFLGAKKVAGRFVLKSNFQLTETTLMVEIRCRLTLWIFFGGATVITAHKRSLLVLICFYSIFTNKFYLSGKYSFPLWSQRRLCAGR